MEIVFLDLMNIDMEDEWPSSVRELAGAWKDFPSLEDIRGISKSDAPREAL